MFAIGCGRVNFDVSPRDDAAVRDAAICAPMLADDFEDGVPSPDWSVDGASAVTIEENGGRLAITLAPGVQIAYASYTSACRYDLRDREFSVEAAVVPNPAANGAEMFIEMSVDAENRMGVVTRDNLTAAFRRVADAYVDVVTVAYDAAAHRFWRLRETAGTAFWEVSADRTSWIVLHSEPTPLDLSVAFISMNGGTFEVETNPGIAAFDDADLR